MSFSSPDVTTVDLLADLLGDGPQDGPLPLREEVRAQTRAAVEALYADGQPIAVPVLHALAAKVAGWQGMTGLRDWHLAQGGDDAALSSLGPAADALIDYVELLSVSPATVSHEDQALLAAAGFGPDAVVLVSQLIAFESYLGRVLAGLAAADGRGGPTEPTVPESNSADRTKHEPATTLSGQPRPQHFTRGVLGWEPWVPAPTVDELTEEQRESFAGKAAVDSVYFRLISRTPALTRARSALDIAIFQGRDGLPKAERELAATVTSKVNDCVFCASVHARKSAGFSKRVEDIDRLLAAELPRDGDWIATDLAPLADSIAPDPRWEALVEAAAHLSQVRPSLTPDHVRRMREVGLDDVEIADLITAAAFFAWANRLMLTLGEPTCPEPGQG